MKHRTNERGEDVAEAQRRAVCAYLAALECGQTSPDLEDAFVRAAPGYAARHGISYASWRQIGVPAHLLDKARVPRPRFPAVSTGG